VTSPLGLSDWPIAPPSSPPTAALDPLAGGDAPRPEPGWQATATTPVPSTSSPVPPSPGSSASQATPRRSSSGSARDGLGLVLVVLGATLLALGNAAVWVDETAQDRATYENASLLDLEEGGLSGIINERLTSTLMGWADIPDRVDAALPGPLSLIGGPAEDLTRRVVDEAIAGTLALPEIEALIERIETTADDELMNLLFAESEWLRLDGDTVVLDLDPLVLEAAYRIDEVIPDWASDAVPALSAETILPDQIDGGGLEVALGEVPVVLEARDALDGLGDLASRYALVGAALVGAGLVLARRRGRTLVGFGLALAVAAAVVGTGLTVEAVFGGEIGVLEDIAGATFVSTDGDALMARSVPLVACGLALATGTGLVLALMNRPARTAVPADPAAR
jgi:hypothetical protein